MSVNFEGNSDLDNGLFKVLLEEIEKLPKLIGLILKLGHTISNDDYCLMIEKFLNRN